MANFLERGLVKAFESGDKDKLHKLIKDGLMERDVYRTVCDCINNWSMKRNEDMDVFPGEYEYSEDVLIELVDILISNGLDVNHPIDDSGERPNLFWGIMNFQNYPRLLEFLIGKGSQLNFKYEPYSYVLDNYLSNVQLDAAAGYKDLGRRTNEGCKIAIYHGALPYHLIEKQVPDYNGHITKETFEIIDAALSLDYDFFAKKDLNFLVNWVALTDLLEFARFSRPKEVFSPSVEFQEELLRITLCIMETTGYNLEDTELFECFAQNLEHLIIGLLKTGKPSLLKTLKYCMDTYGELLKPDMLGRIQTIYHIMAATEAAK